MTTEVLQVVAPPPLPKLLRLSHRQKDVRFEGFEHGVFTVAGQQALQAPAALVYTLLADWDACAEVFHNIQRSEVVRLLPEGMLVKQTCRWSFLAFSGHFDCTFVVRQDSEARTLEFKLRDSSFMRDFRGTWRVTPAVLQSQDSAAPACLVEHTLSVKPLMDMPEPVAKLASGIFLQQVASILDDLANEVDKKMAQRQ